ncbi:MAG: OmpH family outer membrane protein [Chitinophagales bacterium]|jgi:outer membrane protein|nr:OmpH family outer membrane protein [Chitinophagales bacterium]
MKKLVLLSALVGGMFATMNAQKFCFVDMEYMLNKIPAYADAQKQLDNVSQGYQKEIDGKRKSVEDLYKNYQAEQVLMTEQIKQQKIKEIENAEKEVKELQRQRFGPSGDLFKKRQELIKPVQDKVYDEVQKYAQAKALDFIFDKSSGPSMLFASEKYNKSDEILANMGINKTSGGAK